MLSLKQILILCFTICLLVTTAFSAKLDPQDIEQLITHTDNNLNIGIHIEDLTSGETLFEKNSEHSFIPASNLKLYTAVSALLYLHPNYRYETSFLTTGHRDSLGELNGDLYLKFSGAPDFSSDDLKKLIHNLKQAGIKKVVGKIYIDDSTFDDVAMGPGWMWDDATQCFAAPVSPLILNHNCFTLNIKRNTRVYPSDKFVTVKSAGLRFYKKQKHCTVKITANKNNRYKIIGCIPRKTTQMDIAIRDPKQYALATLKNFLRHESIHYKGRIKFKTTPNKARLVVSHKSKPLRDLVLHMLKESDNLYADSIFKTLGHVYSHQAGSWQNANDARKYILHELLQLELKNSVMLDGSGLSQYNLVTPKLTTQLLKLAYHQFNINAELISALPIAGIDGSLHNRLNANAVREKVRAKTGTLSHITSLAGFIDTKSHHTLVFSIYINGANGPMEQYKKLEDQIVTYLAQIDLS